MKRRLDTLLTWLIIISLLCSFSLVIITMNKNDLLSERIGYLEKAFFELETTDFKDNSDTMYIKLDDRSNRIMIMSGLESDVEIICRDFYVNGEKMGD